MPPLPVPRRSLRTGHALLRIVLALASAGASAQEAVDKARWNIEVKRQNTGRGTVDESTRTTLRFDRFPEAGPLGLVRLDLPFPDEKQSFSGSPFYPRPGDVKLRVDSRPLAWGSVPWVPRLELTAPTANPDTLGARKWQLGLGARTSGSLGKLADGAFTYGFLAVQTVSFAGEQDAKDINTSKFELELLDSWPTGYSAKFTLKPVIDWVLDGETGAVAELQGKVLLAHGWHLTLMGGVRAWGSAVASTYGKRLELTAGRRF